ncbi:S8 family peptidase [Streptomyces kronopolitis]
MSRLRVYCVIAGVSAAVVAGLISGSGSASALTDGLWNLDRINQRSPKLDGSFKAKGDGAGVDIYVIDTGVDLEHREFKGRAVEGVDLVGRKDNGDCAGETGVGHGTFVAGIAAGKSTGVAPGARVIRVQALQCPEGEEPWDQATIERKIVQASEWIATHAKRPSVVNMSLTVGRRAPGVDSAVKKMLDAGLTVVAAAGNEDKDSCTASPSGVPGVITTGAFVRGDRFWKYSKESGSGSGYGPCVAVNAPASDIKSTYSGGGTGVVQEAATSWAAPHVAGAAALHLSRNPKATPTQVRSWIISESTKDALKLVPKKTPNRIVFVGEVN